MEKSVEITELPTAAEPAGVPEGTVLDVRHEDGSSTKEVIINELDADGNVTGFHKEVVNG